MTKCPLCEEREGTIDGHVIPRWAFELAKGDQPSMSLVGNPNKPRSRSPIGIYDPDRFCTDCESLSSTAESYAEEVFGRFPDGWTEEKDVNGNRIGWVLPSADIKLLRLFFIQLLLKAHFTLRPEFKDVALGPYAQRARDIFQAWEAPDSPDDFAVVVAKFSPSIKHRDAELSIMLPVRHSFEGRNIYCFNMAGFSIYIKVDRRPFDSTTTVLQLGSDGNRVNAPLLDFDQAPAGLNHVYRAVARSMAAKHRMSKR